ncbi:Complex I-B12 [Caenorhabditis elegans]|uniref:Complex I-B12 n=1 Tax=Caenorhabditis elegans TaxID=6239 RepID=Q9NAI7_CAEEL|nr:Complex I-B12 [Caenorhabditis elegans]CAB54416.1 Complex I-B12 [Caenorhabditis elegans]|eukprot:NP_496707.1 Uncharacterized protein CELE_Y38E10A.24 [Caenorhabditis elegans]
MGTFTATYFLKNAFWDKRGLWTATLAVAYFARCWESAGYNKAEMMKGHSKMYADRLKQLPAHTDAWKY